MVASEHSLQVTPAKAVEQLERDLGLSVSELAAAVNASPRTLARWRANETHPQHEARQRLAALVALDRHLRDTFSTPDAIRAWLHADSRYLGGLTPADAIRVGRFDRVEAALEALDSGVFL